MNAPRQTAEFWRAYAVRLATTLQEAGEQMHPQLHAAIQAVPRHLLTPPPAHPVTGERETPRPDDLVGMAAWFAEAYTPGYHHEPGQPSRFVVVAPDSPAWVARCGLPLPVRPAGGQLRGSTDWEPALIAKARRIRGGRADDLAGRLDAGRRRWSRGHAEHSFGLTRLRIPGLGKNLVPIGPEISGVRWVALGERTAAR
jgi:hypothetical protein